MEISSSPGGGRGGVAVRLLRDLCPSSPSSPGRRLLWRWFSECGGEWRRCPAGGGGLLRPPASPASLRRVLRRRWESGRICTGARLRRWTTAILAEVCCKGLRGLLVDDLVSGCRWWPVLDLVGSSTLPCAFIVYDPVDCGGWLQAQTLEVLSSSGAVACWLFCSDLRLLAVLPFAISGLYGVRLLRCLYPFLC